MAHARSDGYARDVASGKRIMRERRMESIIYDMYDIVEAIATDGREMTPELIAAAQKIIDRVENSK